MLPGQEKRTHPFLRDSALALRLLGLKLMLDHGNHDVFKNGRQLCTGRARAIRRRCASSSTRGQCEREDTGGDAHPALHHAAHKPESTALLLAGGADSTLTNDNGDTRWTSLALLIPTR